MPYTNLFSCSALLTCNCQVATTTARLFTPFSHIFIINPRPGFTPPIPDGRWLTFISPGPRFPFAHFLFADTSLSCTDCCFSDLLFFLHRHACTTRALLSSRLYHCLILLFPLLCNVPSSPAFLVLAPYFKLHCSHHRIVLHLSPVYSLSDTISIWHVSSPYLESIL